jgi:uncharacterized membrane protein
VERQRTIVSLSAVIRILCLANAACWIFVIFFPFAEYCSTDLMHVLSKVLSAVSLVLFTFIFCFGSVLLLRKKERGQEQTFDFTIAIGSVAGSLLLFIAFGKGWL